MASGNRPGDRTHGPRHGAHGTACRRPAPLPLIRTPFAEAEARFSPDLRWIAYTSSPSGRDEVYVRPFDAASPGPSPGAATLISTNGGRQPRWVRGGRELIFQDPDGTIMAVELVIDDALQPGTPQPLFTPPGLYWDVAADGQRFLITAPPADTAVAPITVLMHWR